MWAWLRHLGQEGVGVGVEPAAAGPPRASRPVSSPFVVMGKRGEALEASARRAPARAAAARIEEPRLDSGKGRPGLLRSPPPGAGGPWPPPPPLAVAGRCRIRSTCRLVLLDEGHAPHREVHDLGHEAHDRGEGLVEVDEAARHPADLREDRGLVEPAVEKLVDPARARRGWCAAAAPRCGRRPLDGGSRPGCSCTRSSEPAGLGVLGDVVVGARSRVPRSGPPPGRGWSG